MEQETREILVKLTESIEALGEYLVMGDINPEEGLFIIDFIETTIETLQRIVATLKGEPDN